jgi:hypothetical protein
VLRFFLTLTAYLFLNLDIRGTKISGRKRKSPMAAANDTQCLPTRVGINKNLNIVIPTDCNVTGTDIETPSKPKYALKNLWEHVLIPALETLVAPGGRCEGAMVIYRQSKDTSNQLFK